MNLVVLAALIAACGAAKLDRTYLPPASAKTAGGSPGSLQTPFVRGSPNSLNNGLGGLPKGSYENDFEGVVVDAAAAGTRAAELGETGLGGARIAYGSTNSKVGAAAFKTRPSAFAAAQTDQAFEGSQGSFQAGQNSAFQQGSIQAGSNSAFQQGSSQAGSNSAFQQGSVQVGPNSAFQQGTSQAGSNAAFQQGSFQNGGNNAFQQGFPGSQQPERQRASLDRTASILRYENENNVDNYHYAFETDNGISAEENGEATNGVKAQGGFSYTGDDGQVYSVSYTADEKGYQPRGDHLPTPPPIPEEILRSLELNARDEAAGLVDDGSYDAQRYNAGSDYAESGNANGKYTHQSSKFGGPEADTETFNQNQPSRRPATGQSSFSSQSGQGSRFNGQGSNRKGFGASNSQGFDAQSQSSNRFGGQLEQSSEPLDDDSASGQFGQAGTGNQDKNNAFGSFSSASTQGGSNIGQARPGLGNRNEYLPPVNRPNARPQNGRPMKGRPQAGRPQAFLASSQETSSDEEGSGNAVPLGQQDLQDESRPQQALTSFGKPISGESTSQNEFGSSSNQNNQANRPRPSSIGGTFAQEQSSQSGRPNEYLPPRLGNQNRRPLNKPQNNNNFASQLNQQSDENPEESDDSQTQSFSTSSYNGSPFGSQFGQQPTSFKRPQSYRPGQNVNAFPSKSETQYNSATAQSFGLNSQKATAQPATELTTPFESNNEESSPTDSQNVSGNVAQYSQASVSRPTQASFSNQYNQAQVGFDSQSNTRPQASRPQKPRPFGASQASAFPTQPSVEQFSSNSQFSNQPLTQNSYDQNEDGQYSSSTQRPSFTGQPQGPDDAYYYNQPSKPFGMPQASRFPSAPFNQFDRVTQQSSFGQNQIPNAPSTGFTKQPRPPALAPVSPTTSVQSQFGNYYPRPGSTRQPRPPTLAPTIPSGSVQSQYQGNAVNGVTQASISPFPAQTPTQASQGQFGSFQQSQFTQASQPASSTFGQKPNQSSFGQPSRRPSGSFQSQDQTFGQQVENLDEPSNDESAQSVPSQQYTGEIYEYTKPAVTLPPPDSTPVSPSGKFEQKMPGQGQSSQSQAQFGQGNDEEEEQTASQFSSQSPTNYGSRPQFSQSKPFSQNNFGAQAKPDEDTKPFGALAQSQAMFGAQASQQSQPQFGQSRPQYGQTQNRFDQSETAQDSEEGPRPVSVIELSSDEDAESQSPEGPKNQFGFESACCKDNASRKPGQNQFGVQSQFAQSSFAGSQIQPTSSFSGVGEQFGGPRKPPSYDEETGYHY